jgi:hypothetical protein
LEENDTNDKDQLFSINVIKNLWNYINKISL